ncbi:MAG TPA: glycosyltransferase family 4 protein, partial [Terriglobales bacterium]|nr:glycosyltransferase family 4 protein [Terriglobales bacterium]
LEQGRDVYLVGHSIDPEILKNPRVHPTVVPRPVGVLLAEGSLKRAGVRVATQVTRRWPDARVVVNGGNCPWPDINWVHSVHAAWPRFDARAPLWFRAKSEVSKQKARRDELNALQRAKLVIANSQRTRRGLIAIGIPPEKIQVIYLGSEPDWRPPTNAERQEARKSFGLSQDTNVVSFVGGLGYDCNKGFDTLLAAWKEANLDDAVLLAAGAGRGFIHWRREIERLGQHGRVRLLGFTDRVADLLNASDLFVSPVRYEAFGMNVLEAIYRGVPSIVSKSAGISELYPKELSDWLLDDPEDVHSLREALRAWHKNVDFLRSKLDMVSLNLREHTMKQMGQKLISVAEGDKK